MKTGVGEDRMLNLNCGDSLTMGADPIVFRAPF